MGKSTVKKASGLAFQAGVEEDPQDEGEWDQEERKEKRYARIRDRVPTGHYILAKQLLAAQALEDEGEESNNENGDFTQEEEPTAVNIKSTTKATKSSTTKTSHKHKKATVKPAVKKADFSSEQDQDQQLEEGGEEEDSGDGEIVVDAQPVPKKSSQHKKSAKVNMSAVDDEDANSATQAKPKKPSKAAKKEKTKVGAVVEDENEEWDARHQQRVVQIQKRKATGHPGMAQKVMALRKELYGDDEDVGDNEEEEEVKSKVHHKKVDIGGDSEEEDERDEDSQPEMPAAKVSKPKKATTKKVEKGEKSSSTKTSSTKKGKPTPSEEKPVKVKVDKKVVEDEDDATEEAESEQVVVAKQKKPKSTTTKVLTAVPKKPKSKKATSSKE